MKIVGWNLLNVGNTKLGKAFTPGFAALGLGNTIMDYITGLVMGNAVWNNLGITNLPADVFVIIELKTGGSFKGGAVSGTCIPTLTTIVNALNVYAVANGHAATHQYAFATPLITGHHESVGVVYNTMVFNPAPPTQTLRDNLGNNLNPRTPFMATLTQIVGGGVFEIVGIHAPPKGGGGVNVQYKPPVDFVRRMGTITELDATLPMNPPDYFVMGDYNCNPTSTYTNGLGAVISGFGQLIAWGYNSLIPNGTLTSLRTGVNGAFLPPANYLSDSYDNLLYNFDVPPVGPINERVLDLIANARNFNPPPPTVPPVAAYPGNLVMVLNNNRKVSDHLPFVIEF
jgi:hypothetical protein